ncbi:SPX domain-containing protein [Apodospora peruviana]|uniref:SPX domain-containing protein n=1 Tax=Apodospora peruviana TaxID=516989 RepID=A0AAE0I173_9PEZI|nr:SPX domain-containing protein [Apodospora peruviana]
MKYGEQFESESVPQWSLYNIDYNSLKHHIKAHTTKDQASAIAIPGQRDTALSKFEDELYIELCRQHDRVNLFVKSKADELSRRLQHLSNQIHRLILRCTTSRLDRVSLKRQSRFARYESELLRCGDEIQALQRFVSAQIVAFRKILKKYKKWTGSSTLGARFNDAILSHPKSFTRRNMSGLQAHYDDLLEALRAASSADHSGAASPRTEPPAAPRISTPPQNQLSPSETIVAAQQSPPRGYWNEYDNGSEAGDIDQDRDTSYAIYVDPNADMSFPGLATLKTIFKKPSGRWKVWTGGSQEDQTINFEQCEQGPLLRGQSGHYGTTDASYFAPVPGGTWNRNDSDDDTEQEGSLGRRGSYGYTSSEEGFPAGYKAHYAALPSIRDQRVAQYRERVLFWGTWGCYAVSFALMAIAAILVSTGRHKKRLEVDAGVTMGIMVSLASACAALWLSCSRQGGLGWVNQAAVWATFAAACVLNGALLVLVVGNPPLPL